MVLLIVLITKLDFCNETVSYNFDININFNILNLIKKNRLPF